jgi:SWIM zinc finger
MGILNGTPVSVTISADDPRSIRAIEIAANASRWRVSRAADGQEIFRVPSQSQPSRLYLVTEHTCTCADFQHSAEAGEARACKHILAVRLYCELVKAQSGGAPELRRGHLRLVR